MHKQSAEKKQTRKIVAVALALIMALTAAMPTNAMSEMLETEKTEQALNDSESDTELSFESMDDQPETQILEENSTEEKELEVDGKTEGIELNDISEQALDAVCNLFIPLFHVKM